MIPILTTSQARSMNAVCAARPSASVQSLIMPVSKMIKNICRGAIFGVERFPTESYDRAFRGELVLAAHPIIQLNSVTLSPDVNPTVLTASSFDIRYQEGRINIKPTAPAVFINGGWYGNESYPFNMVNVDYHAGRGWVTSLTAPVSPGDNVVLPLAATYGYSPEQGPWSIGNTNALVLDPGQPYEENVLVATNSSGQAVAMSVLYPHASGAFVGGGLIPPDVQFAAARMIGNILASPDGTKSMEGLANRYGYEWQVRKSPSGTIVDPEVLQLLMPYFEVNL